MLVSAKLQENEHELKIYAVSQKQLGHYTFVHNFDKCWPIFKILSLMYSPRNLQQYKRMKLAKFCCI